VAPLGAEVSAQGGPGTYALLTDGTTIEIRPARPDDVDAVRDMHATMSRKNFYLRFFGVSRVAAEREARRICREPSPDHAALLAVLDGRVVGCGAYEVAGDGSGSAEVSLAVADDLHNHGVGTLLLEHLISLARGQGVRTFVAETLTENALMLQVFANAGLRAHRTLQDGVYDLRFPLPGGEGDAGSDTYREAVAERERSADVASLKHVLTPASVAVIGVSRSRGSLGWTIVRNIIAGGFSGPVYAVGSGAADLDGVPCVPSPAALPEQVDLAVIAVPATAVPGVAEECGQRGVRALAVTTSGLDGAARAELLGICRRHGMRLVGPSCFGLANTAICLDATFAARHPRPGMAGLASQSTGGAGFALIEHLSRLGVGISSLVSLGDKDDVSGTDMLRWWESDPATKLVVLYLESFGNPRKFARTARHVGRSVPILTVSAGRPAAGLRRAAIRAAAEVTPQLTRRALFGQAGVIATANLGELLDTAALLASQPLPAGDRLGVVSNTRGGAVLAADAVDDAGLQLASLSARTQQALRELLPPGAAVAGPVDTTAMAGSGLFRQCLELVGADPGVDAVLALTAATAAGDPVPGVAAARLPVPIAAAAMDQAEAVRMLTGPGGDGPPVPAYAYPESAARALGYAARYAAWRAAPPGSIPELGDLREDRARELVAGFLAAAPRGGWLPREQTGELLGCYGVTLTDRIAVTTEEDAVAAAARSGGRVALKADVPGLAVRRKGAGAVLLDLHGADEIRRGYRSLRETFAGRLSGIIVQPMITGGVEVKISVLEEQVFGPLVLLGLAGSAADELADRAARFAPLTSSDADDLIRSVHAPLLAGRPGEPAADLASVKDMLLRVSQLADDLPQIAELDLSPVIVRRDGAVPIDARIRIQPARPADAYLRKLPLPGPPPARRVPDRPDRSRCKAGVQGRTPGDPRIRQAVSGGRRTGQATRHHHCGLAPVMRRAREAYTSASWEGVRPASGAGYQVATRMPMLPIAAAVAPRWARSNTPCCWPMASTSASSASDRRRTATAGAAAAGDSACISLLATTASIG
jgi:acyl-CoA synthetase (NDP forming)/GNAT superfamily N-acetyltransferase